MSAKVLVLGASSPVGTRVISALEAKGQAVSAVTRRANPPLRLTHGEWIRTDLGGSDASLDLSGYSHVVSLMPIDIAAGALSRARLEGFLRCVAISSTSVSTKENANSHLDRSLAERLRRGEEKLQECLPEVTVLRPTMIYFGPGDRNLERIVSHVRRFKIFPLIGGGHGLRQPIHADDVAQAIVTSVQHPSLPRTTYEIGGGEVLSVREMVHRVATASGLSVSFVSIPLTVARTGLAAASVFPRFRGIPMGALERMSKDMIFDNDAAREDFGFSPRGFQPMDYLA